MKLEPITYNINEYQYDILYLIKGTIDLVTERMPDLYEAHDNYVAIFWKIKEEQDSIYQMFPSRTDMESYNKDIKRSFEEIHEDMSLNFKYTNGPVEIDNILYSRIIYYYYDSSVDGINTFFVS